jgi:uncharacterized protein YdbL (DUF1318 family)
MNTALTSHVKILLLISVLCAPLMAWAVGLDAAKQQGLVGEQSNGYLGSVAGAPSAQVSTLIKDVNAKRRAKYQQIATKNSISMADVEALAGEKAIARTASGNYIKPAAGGWRRK